MLLPPTSLGSLEWVKRHVRFNSSDPCPGHFRPEYNPAAALFIEHFGHPDVRTLTMMAAAQIGKSTAVFCCIGWAACERPGRAFWVMADAEMARETVDERLLPFLANIEPCRERLPRARTDKQNLLIRLSTMSIHVRGSNSKGKLQSTPVMYLFLDEVRNYRKGALELVLKRVRAFREHKIVYISTPMDDGDVMHRTWQQGTRTLLMWPCPHCGHWQPFRFGRDESPIYGAARPKGGFRWLENETTRPGGIWNIAEAVKEIWYECEACGGRIDETMKFQLLANVRPVHTNPSPLPGHYSIHTWVAYVGWIPWRDIVVEFLQAAEALKQGDIEPLRAFVRETLGEPWLLRGQKADAREIDTRRGAYKRHEKLPDPRGVRILTVDIQQDAMVFKYVYRQHLPGGESRLLDYGVLASYDDVRTYQLQHRIKDKCVWVDTGHRATETYRHCLRFGWVATKGDKGEGYSRFDPIRRRNIMVPWRIREIDPFLGTNMAGRTTLPLVRFASAAYKDRLYLFVVNGKGPRWEVFHDVGDDYIAELTADEIVMEGGKRVWLERGTNDYGDCEILQLVAADVIGLTPTERVPVVPQDAANGEATPALTRIEDGVNS